MLVWSSRRRTAILIAVVFLAGAPAGAQSDYPSKPIRFLVGSTAGGATDILARTVGQKLADNLHQQVVVDNRPGANQIIAAELTANSPPDGYTILMVPAGFTINPALYPKLPYDPRRDFTPLAIVANVPNVLVVHPSLPVRSVRELIELARKRPGQLSYGSSGIGSPSHLCGELFNIMAKVDLTHVPYKGNGQTMIDLIGGHLQLSFPSIPTSIAYIKSNRMRPLAIATAQRSLALPELPTIAEAGLPGYEVSGWYGVLGPARIPKQLVAKINGEINRVLQVPEIRETLSRQGADPLVETPEGFAAMIAADLLKWPKVVAAARIKPEQ